MTDHARHIDPHLAAQKCNPAEQEVVRLVNLQMSWTNIVALTGRSRGSVRREWNEANRKVNGGYVPARSSKEERELERLQMMADPDILRGLHGIPVVGLGKPGAGIVPGRPTRSGKVGS